MKGHPDFDPILGPMSNAPNTSRAMQRTGNRLERVCMQTDGESIHPYASGALTRVWLRQWRGPGSGFWHLPQFLPPTGTVPSHPIPFCNRAGRNVVTQTDVV